MSRPEIDVYMMGMAMMAASRATCGRRSVGCVLTSKLNHIIATGYNGVPRGMVHCGLRVCPGLTAASGTSLDGCMATHAEQNALLQCRNVEEIHTAYCTTCPCLTCTKLLMNTGCKTIVYLQSYPHEVARQMWTDSGRTLHQLPSNKVKELAELFRNMSGRSEYALTMSQEG